MAALSEIRGPALESEEGLGSLTLPGFIAEIGATHAGRQALRWRALAGTDRSWTYAEMHAQSLKVARALLAAGAGRGTRVGLLISNRPEWICSMFGTAMAGGVTVALNTFSTLQELEYQLRHCDIEILIMDEATSMFDPDSELRLLERMKPWFAQRTVIFITHRTAPVALATRVLVAENGQVFDRPVLDIDIV